MEHKRAVSAKVAAKYRSCRGRTQRSQILEEVRELTGYTRHYAAWLLRNIGKIRLVRTSTGQVLHLIVGQHYKRQPTERSRKYGEEVKKVLLLLWESFDQMCGKRLAAILPDVLGAFFAHRGMKKSGALYGKLRTISAATIDRILRAERAKRRLKGIAHTKPSSILKNTIPIVISSELSREQPGQFQMDLVSHDGGNPNGQFAFSQNAVELYSGWVEPRILLNKAHSWVKKAAENVKSTSPIPVKGFHTDNDSVFINEALQSWCRQQGIGFSRGRPYHSNDTCYVEQKNYNIVRQALGYARYETEEEVALIGRLYEKLRLLVNFFYPSMKLVSKHRVGAKIHKLYDKPRSPARRLLECPAVSEAAKEALRRQMRQLDPFRLKGEIARLQTKLLRLVRKKNLRVLYPGPSYLNRSLRAALKGEDIDSKIGEKMHRQTAREHAAAGVAMKRAR
jgi:hypothetical protein